MTPTATQRVAAWAAALRPADVPADVREAAELHALDAAGCALAALGVGEGTAVRATATEEGGAPQATAIGVASRVPATAAALVNGTLAHALDFDDTHDASICHVSSVVTPAALAAGEAAGAAEDEVLTAIVAGNELTCRLGAAIAPALYERGFHPTSVCGVFGATLAAGRLRGLDAAGLERALGLAGSMAAGLFAYLTDGSPTKPLHAGLAASSGVRAATLAAHGLRGPAAVLEGRFGVLEAYAGGDGDLDAQLADLGTRWETPRIAFKAYPACHFVHGALDALRDTGVAGADVATVDATIAAAGAGLVCDPREEKLAPTTPYGARFSLPFALAAQLAHGSVGADTFSSGAIGDAAVLVRTVDVRTRTWPAGAEPSRFAGEVTVTLRDGTVTTARADEPHGLDAAGVRAKAQRNAALAGTSLEHFGGVLAAFADAAAR